VIVVADSGPLLYLILVGEIDLLRQFYGEVRIPPAVERDLSSAGAPAQVVEWIANLPEWVRVETVRENVIPTLVGAGESEAIALAVALPAGLVLLDDRAARNEARRQNLEVTGTLGVLRIAAERGLIDVPQVITRLQTPSFYFGADLIISVFGKWLPS
jgi:predicted nucleic acid-binding protein